VHKLIHSAHSKRPHVNRRKLQPIPAHRRPSLKTGRSRRRNCWLFDPEVANDVSKVLIVSVVVVLLHRAQTRSRQVLLTDVVIHHGKNFIGNFKIARYLID
jgi:hypothetical protein